MKEKLKLMKKKLTSIQLQIPTPCTEDLTKMHPLPGGRYCDKCERTVVDFREMTDHEIVKLYQQRQGRVCGIFKPHQLDRPLSIPQPPKEGRPWLAIAALTSSLMLAEALPAQNLPKRDIQQVDIRSQANSALPKPLGSGHAVMEGWVKNEQGEPLAFATLLAGNGQGTETDFEGFFSMKLPIEYLGTEVEVSYMGHTTKKVLFEEEMQMEIVLKAGLTLPEVVVIYDNSHSYTHYGGAMSMVSQYVQNGQETKEEFKEVPSVQVLAYPNPFISYVNVEIEVPSPDAYLFHLYNESGQLVFAQAMEMEAGLRVAQLDLVQQHLPEGAYFMRISDKAGEIRTKKLMKASPK
ncbi:MAG: T9SS type A sorting domain-containing protein [Saprospiraceae bacterium]|nr:T9SS type A sorting domain-containing protein [Saprospiraceae bacterium]